MSPNGSWYVLGSQLHPTSYERYPTHRTWCITKGIKRGAHDGSEVFQLEQGHSFPFLTGKYQCGEKREEETFGHLGTYEEFLKLPSSR